MKSQANGKRRRTQQEVKALLGRYHKSGKTVRAFCEAEGVSESVLYRWLGRARKQAAGGKLVEVRAPADMGGHVIVETPAGYRVEVPASFPMDELKNLLGSLVR